MPQRPVGPWLVRGRYTFIESGVTLDALDGIVGGTTQWLHGGIRSIDNSGRETCALEWRVETLDMARAAAQVLKAINVVSDVRVARGDGVLQPREYQIRASDARAGQAICVACGKRIAVMEGNFMALEGVRPDNEVALSCESCGMRMDWVILHEE